MNIPANRRACLFERVIFPDETFKKLSWKQLS
jgi:hypothetical protein